MRLPLSGGFLRIRPQVVRNLRHGYTVQIGSRFTVEYLESGHTAEVDAEFGGGATIYREGLRWVGERGALPGRSDAEVLERVVAGMRALSDGPIELV